MKKLESLLACPVCGSSISFSKGIQCLKCKRKYRKDGTVYYLLPNQMTKDVVLSKTKWEDVYSKQLKRGDFRKDPTVISYKRFLDNYIKYFKKGIFLDLGCGIAWTAATLAEQRIQVVEADVSGEAIQKSATLFKKNKLAGNFVQADLLQLPFRKESFNFIYSCMSLEYVKDTQKSINEAFRVLKKRGRMVAIVPVISLTTLTYHQLRGDIPNLPIIKNIMEFIHLKIFGGKYMHYGYEKSFTPGNFKKMFKHVGFKIERLDFFDMHYPIEFAPKPLRGTFQKLLKYRPFWPLMYIEVVK